MTDDPGTDRLALGFLDRLTIQAPQRWQLFHTVTPAPWGKGPYTNPEILGGRFTTPEDCEASRQRKLTILHQMVARQPPGQVHMRRLDDGVESGNGKHFRRETWFCAGVEDQPS